MHSSRINRIDIDSQERYVLTCSHDKTARLWDLNTGDLIKIFKPSIGAGQEGQLTACALSPDGRIAAVGGHTLDNDGYNVFLFDTTTGRLLRVLKGIESSIVDLEFSPDEKYLAACSINKGLTIFNTASWSETAKLKGYSGRRISESFAPDGRLVTVCEDRKIRLYDSSFRLLRQKKISGLPVDVSFSPDGRRIAIGFGDKPLIQVLDAESLSNLYEPAMDNVGAKRHFARVCWSKDGSKLLAGGNHLYGEIGVLRYQIRIWEDKGKGAFRDLPAALNTIMTMHSLEDGGVVFGGFYPDLGRIHGNGKKQFYRKGEILDLRAKDKSHLKLRADGLALGFSSVSTEREPFSFSILDRRLEHRQTSFPAPQDQRAGVKITHWRGTFEPRQRRRSGDNCSPT